MVGVIYEQISKATMSWDDGTHAKVKKVHITYDDVIYSVQVTYGTALQVQTPRRGSVGPMSAEFTLESDEYITALSGYALSTQDVVTSLTFTTNKKTYGPYGNKFGYQISVLEKTGKQIAGFRGKKGKILNSVDVHYAPIPTGTSGLETSSGAQKLHVGGLAGGTAWDDGSDHDGVTNIYVGWNLDGIQYVMFGYVKDGQPKQGGHHGSTNGYKGEIVINDPGEHLVSVEGWYDSTNFILGIQFKTNGHKIYDSMGFKFNGDTDTKFTLQVQDKKIIGIHGFASDHLNSIGAYFVPLPSTTTLPIVPPEKVGAVWDDGAYGKVKKVFIGLGQDGITSVKFEYKNGSKVVKGVEHGTPTLLGFEKFTLQLGSDEYITAYSAYVEKLATQNVVTSLTFTTNKKNYGPYGNKSGFEIFVPEETGKQIAGFHGISGNVLNTLGGYYAPIPMPPTKKLDAEGGTGGTAWDDGSDHDGVTKIYVRTGAAGVQYVKFDYVKDGQPKQETRHGVDGSRGLTREIVINYPDEHLVSVEGWYDSSNIILGIQFKTNKKTSDYLGFESDGTGTEFTLQVQNKIIGFHGFSSNHLHSIGAYFVPLPSTTSLPIVPSKKLGAVWDDHTHDKVKKVFVGLGQDGIASVKFVYIDGSYRVYGVERGKPTLLGFEEFTLGSYEYITALSAYTKTLSTQDVVTSLTFTTNKKTYGPYGNKSGLLFSFPEETGKQIAGFHGTSDSVLNSIEVHYAPIPAVQKLDAQGSTGGTEWDDGSDHDGVTNICLGFNWLGIRQVMFSYVKDEETKQGSQHGLKDRRGQTIDIVINHPDEYLVSVEGWYDSSNTIMGIKFETNQKIHDYMGLMNASGTKFSLQVQDKKIVGFHGFSTAFLHSVGAYFAPLSSTTTTPIVTPKELEAKGGESES
ncbi:jacalin-related lectin 34-like [Raphanus sativus]|uniref:Jacalin-related lectin 34-like n=1 Tax=Raphanus sativus TaxID=3726 RepID=A0A6J0NSW2_RAPSA|nr:jacalin-related lectin 34-like [Raphanus sativus]